MDDWWYPFPYLLPGYYEGKRKIEEFVAHDAENAGNAICLRAGCPRVRRLRRPGSSRPRPTSIRRPRAGRGCCSRPRCRRDRSRPRSPPRPPCPRGSSPRWRHAAPGADQPRRRRGRSKPKQEWLPWPSSPSTERKGHEHSKHRERTPGLSAPCHRGPGRSPAQPNQEKRRDDRGTARVSQPPDEPHGADVLGVHCTREVQGAGADRGAHGRAQEHAVDQKGDDVPKAGKGRVEVGHPNEQRGCQNGLDRVAYGNGERRCHPRPDHRIGNRRPYEHSRPDASSEERECGERESRWGPDERRVLLEVRERQAQPSRDYIQNGDARYDRDVPEARGALQCVCVPAEPRLGHWGSIPRAITRSDPANPAPSVSRQRIGSA
jgi:hypothetical protein